MKYFRQATPAEDMAMWRFAMEDHGRGRMGMWEVFREKTGSERTAVSLHSRFRMTLIPNLPNTKFHVETKLKLCQKHNVKVDEAFLEKLSIDALVQLDDRGNVISYQLKTDCPENRDMQLSDEEFMKLTSPVVAKMRPFTPEEDAETWRYVLQNRDAPKRNGFWKELAQRLNTNRRPDALLMRFRNYLLPNLHKMDFPIEQKLMVYKKHQIAVNTMFMKTLVEHAELIMNEDGVIIDYQLKTDRAEKRKNTEDDTGEAKKWKVDHEYDEEELQLKSSPPKTSNQSILDQLFPPQGIGKEGEVVPGTLKANIEINDNVDQSSLNQFIGEPSRHVEQGLLPMLSPNLKETDSGYQSIPPATHTFLIPKQEVLDEEENPVNESQPAVNSDGSIAQMFKMMQRMEKTLMDQSAEFRSRLQHLEASIEGMKKGQETCFTNEVTVMKNSLEATFDEKITKSVQVVGKGMLVLQREMKSLRDEMKNGSTDDTPASGKKKYLLNLQKIVSSVESTEMEAVGQRIETALQNLPEDDDSPVPGKALSGILEVALTLIGS